MTRCSSTRSRTKRTGRSGNTTPSWRGPRSPTQDDEPRFTTTTNMAKQAAITPSLTGIAAIQPAFLFLDGPANVLRAATTCSRWRELATADSVWRAKAVREGIVEKAGVFEVPLPAAAAAAAAGDSGGGASSGDGPASTDKLAGVGLAFYAQIYVLQVGPARSLVSVRRHRHCAPYHSSC